MLLPGTAVIEQPLPGSCTRGRGCRAILVGVLQRRVELLEIALTPTLRRGMVGRATGV